MAAPMNGTNGFSHASIPDIYVKKPRSERFNKEDRRTLGEQTICDVVQDFFISCKDHACSFWRRIRGTVHITIPDFWLMKITMLVIMGFGIYAFGTYTGNWVYSWFV